MKRFREQRGQTLLEFTFAAMAFLLLVFGIMEMGRMFQSWVTVQHAAREAARWGITGQSACAIAPDDRPACIEFEAMESLVGLNGANTATVNVRSWQFPDYADPAAEGSAGGACDLLEVQIDYTHSIVVPLISNITGDQIPLTGRERMLNEPFGTCE